MELVRDYIGSLLVGKVVAPPEILIELYFDDDATLASLKGIINTQNEDLPGVSLRIELNSEDADAFVSYVADPSMIRTLPVEYYHATWRSFADRNITAQNIPVKPSFIDASTIRSYATASRYVLDVVKDNLSTKQQVDISLSYRQMKDAFLSQERVKGINDWLANEKKEISDKTLSISLDTSSRTNWEANIMPQLDDVPLTLVGKGEQNSVKIKLAMLSSSQCHLVLIEEPENHLSFLNLNTLISHLTERRGSRQLIITTHSSFVLNKLGIESVILFNRGESTTLKSLSSGSQDYFIRLPGHDTLRLILAKHPILVEGPSDELIVQAAYKKQYGKLPLEAGIDVISVRSLAFKRFLEIADLIGIPVTVVTDSDGDVSALQEKYKDYLGKKDKIRILYDPDEKSPTLEPQMLKANGKAAVEKVLGRAFGDEPALLEYMKKNKVDVALAFFAATKGWTAPKYILDAIK
jgi:putative ATP-dependent endonuclease of the OLD family